MSRKTAARRAPRRPRKKATAPRRAAAPRKVAAAIALESPVTSSVEALDAEVLAPPGFGAPAAPVSSVEEGLLVEPLPDVPMAEPEREYAARVTPPPPERPMPASRRAVFFDVENSSHAPHIERTIHHLAIDRGRARTDFVAVGNWRVIGQDTARLLARHGAQLVHSAPATGVRDWSDLRIAVSAGVWLATARPGDLVEIVSDDRAFDAVGDVAAALGIEFRRLSYRALFGAPAAEPREEAPAPRGHRRGRRSRRGPGPGRAHGGPAERGAGERRQHAPPPAPAPAPPPVEAEPHTAPHDEIVHVVQELVARAPGRPVLIDTLARELKARGFARPPGSPRLITRLRRIRELSVSPTGMITLIGEGHVARSHPVAVEPPAPQAPAAPAPEEVEEDGLLPGEVDGNRLVPAAAPAAARPSGRPPRRRRRGGRGRGRATA